MRLLLDADGIIKAHRAGILKAVVAAFECWVPQAVYEEVVVQGKSRLYEDAALIEDILAGGAQVTASHRAKREPGLGAGESAVLELYHQDATGIVVSDDRRFLSVLTVQNVPFLTPSDLLLVLTREGVIAVEEARDALERLRPAIRDSAYREAKEGLEQRGSR